VPEASGLQRSASLLTHGSPGVARSRGARIPSQAPEQLAGGPAGPRRAALLRPLGVDRTLGTEDKRYRGGGFLSPLQARSSASGCTAHLEAL